MNPLLLLRSTPAFLLTVIFCSIFLCGCGGGNKEGSASNVDSTVTGPTSTATASPTPAPTIEEVDEPTFGAFQSGSRIAMNLRVSDNTTPTGITTGPQNVLAPDGWQFNGSWNGNSRVDIWPSGGDNLPPFNPQTDRNLEWRIDDFFDVPAGSALSGNFYALVRGQSYTHYSANQEHGVFWRMSGGDILVEQNGSTEQPNIHRLRLRLRGVHMVPALLAYGLLWSDPVVYEPGTGSFTVNGIIILEQDTSFSNVYVYTGATRP